MTGEAFVARIAALDESQGTAGGCARWKGLVPGRGLVRQRGKSLARERVVAVGLLTQRDLDALGSSFDRLWPVDETPCFAGLLEAIDEADRALSRRRDKEDADAAAAGSRT